MSLVFMIFFPGFICWSFSDFIHDFHLYSTFGRERASGGGHGEIEGEEIERKSKKIILHSAIFKQKDNVSIHNESETMIISSN